MSVSEFFSDLGKWLTSKWSEKSSQPTYERVLADRTTAKLNPTPIKANQHYYRVVLAQMYITKSVDFGQRRFPAVHSLVQATFGSTTIEIPNIADTSRLGAKEAQGAKAIVAQNFHLTPAMPFKGGTLKLNAGLIEVMGDNYINSFIQVLGGFAELLVVPQLSAALHVAKPLLTGIHKLVTMGNGSVKLQVEDTFSASGIQDCYLVVIGAPNVKTDRLWVVDNQLVVGRGLGQGEHSPYTEHEFMLFRFEVFEERDDWKELTAIAEPFKEAQLALGRGGKKEAAAAINRAIAAALNAPELTEAQQTIAASELRELFEARKRVLGGQGLGQAPLISLDDLMRSPAMSVEDALDHGPLNLSQALVSEND
ncbi:MAG TPA: hypothetical protein PKD53_07590 [Chloroflexaceae bacterium]|nr:hypothetical protein [Chloroflexaceae bacterium]